MKKHHVLVVDDDKLMTWSLKEKLNKEGFEVKTAESGKQALKIIHEDFPDLAFVDVFLPDIDGIQVLKEIMKINEEIPVVMITGHGTVDTAVTAMKLGAYEYIQKPFNLQEVAIIAKKANESRSIKREMNRQVEKAKETHSIDNIIGESLEIKKILEVIHKVAKSDASTILIEGESGTGKDIVSKAIHYTSARANKPFMDINCTAMPNSLVESELFGYEKGAFTDAKWRKMGLFELADGGTVLLDEIGDVSLSTQAKLLKLIENKIFKRIGGSSDIEVDIRVIAATNKNIREEVKKGNFREDLYYRLKVIPILIPPLCQRKSDIILLANYFINKFNKEFRKNVKGISAKTEKALIAYNWPGNVRELKNVIERALILESTDQILLEHLPTEVIENTYIDKDPNPTVLLPKNGISLEEVEKNFLLQALKLANGNQSKAAQLLGLTRYALRYRLKKFGCQTDKELNSEM